MPIIKANILTIQKSTTDRSLLTTPSDGTRPAQAYDGIEDGNGAPSSFSTGNALSSKRARASNSSASSDELLLQKPRETKKKVRGMSRSQSTVQSRYDTPKSLLSTTAGRPKAVATKGREGRSAVVERRGRDEKKHIGRENGAPDLGRSAVEVSEALGSMTREPLSGEGSGGLGKGQILKPSEEPIELTSWRDLFD